MMLQNLWKKIIDDQKTDLTPVLCGTKTDLHLFCAATTDFVDSDTALWPSPITDILREYFIHNEAKQNMNFLNNSKKVFGKVE